jgi:hypothetical protein
MERYSGYCRHLTIYENAGKSTGGYQEEHRGKKAIPSPPESKSDEPLPRGTALAPAVGVTRLSSCS